MKRAPGAGSPANEDGIAGEVMQLLLVCPSSFAALYGYLVRNFVAAPGSLRSVWECVLDLQRRGLVRLWHEELDSPLTDLRGVLEQYLDWLDPMGDRDLTVDAVSYDPVGVWCELTSAGREQSDPAKSAPEWTLDFSDETGELVVCARTDAQADDAVRCWQRLNPRYQEVNRTASPATAPWTIKLTVRYEEP